MTLTLKDHMSRKLITVGRETTAKEAQRIMTNFWIRHLPVMDEPTGMIVGMLSERDVLRSPSLETPVEQLMSSPVRTFGIETPLVSVVEAMIDEKLSAFLITKEDEVVGLVTTEDMLVVLNEILKGDESRAWVLNEILINPALQRAAYIIGQAGI